MTGRSLLGLGLLAAGLVLAVVSYLLWHQASEDLVVDQLTEDMYAATVGDRPARELEANRAPSAAAAGVGAVLFLSGVIVLATDPGERRVSDDDR